MEVKIGAAVAKRYSYSILVTQVQEVMVQTLGR